jgi:hypothetical protein
VNEIEITLYFLEGKHIPILGVVRDALNAKRIATQLHSPFQVGDI